MTDSVFVDRGVSEPAQLTNMRLALSTMLDCQDAGDGSPRMGLFYGPSGYGKSVAAATVTARMDGVYYVADPTLSPKSFYSDLATELGIVRKERTISGLFKQIRDELKRERRPVIIDEMDTFVKKNLVEYVRAIADGAGVPVLMIGEEAMPQKLKNEPDWERFDNRVLVATAAQPASLADARLLRAHYCNKVAIADDLLEEILRQTKGVTRRIVVNLHNVQAVAIAAGQGGMDRAGWGNRPFMTGAVVTRRAA